ncbi:porin [Permianibacter aggregans]|uniref:Putative porin n=1 Tax=Permianibacter aggregans TaxID=1510150 RepID=A0A4R6UN05_9GAMM|nr:porin [Permianibacter aggregans]QGX40870.1 porin [Permianibacter aggregans]TDQ48311.1 putative porin [Permianibacter aggregans]
MNTRLTLIAATLAALSAPSFAGSALELYGKINVTVESEDSDASGDKVKLVSNASRFGIKGDLGISEGLEAFYQLEWEVDPADADKGSNDNIKSRNQIVGLKGSAGKVFAGRHDTPLKVAQNKVDLFNDYVGDIKTIFNGEIRASNIIQYSTPEMGGFGVNVASVLQEGKNGNDGAFDATSLSVEWSNKNVYVAVAQDSGVETYAGGAEDIDTLRVVGQFKLGNFQIGALWQEREAATDDDGMLFSLAYKAGDHTFKGQFGESDILAQGGESTSVGWDYKLAKNIQTTVFYTMYENDGANSGKDNLGLGLEVKF